MTLIFGSDRYRLDSRCNATGFWGSLEETLLGRRFWRAQFTAINEKIAYWESLPEKIELQKEQDRKLKERADEQLDELYDRRPDLQPSPNELKAQLLREQADAIEEAESEAEFERYRLDKLAELKRCLAMAERKKK